MKNVLTAINTPITTVGFTSRAVSLAKDCASLETTSFCMAETHSASQLIGNRLKRIDELINNAKENVDSKNNQHSKAYLA